MFYHIINDQIQKAITDEEFVKVANEFYAKYKRPLKGEEIVIELKIYAGAFFVSGSPRDIEYYIFTRHYSKTDEIDHRTGFNFSLYARDEAYRETFQRELVGISSTDTEPGSPAYRLDNGHIVRHNLSGSFTWIK